MDNFHIMKYLILLLFNAHPSLASVENIACSCFVNDRNTIHEAKIIRRINPKDEITTGSTEILDIGYKFIFSNKDESIRLIAIDKVKDRVFRDHYASNFKFGLYYTQVNFMVRYKDYWLGMTCDRH